MTTKVLCYFTGEMVPVDEAVRVTLVDLNDTRQRIQVFATKAAIGNWIANNEGDVSVTYNQDGGYEVQV